MIAIGTKNLSKLVTTDLLDLHEILKKNSEIKYIETSLEYDNDLYLKGKLTKDIKVLARIPSTYDLEVICEYHRLSLGVEEDKFCVLLPGSIDLEDKSTLKSIREIRKKYSVGLYEPTKNQYVKYVNSMGVAPDMMSLTMNPLVFPKEFIEYAKKKQTVIISHGIFGGEMWAGYTRQIFPDGFLYDFARVNSDIQVLPFEDHYFFMDILEREKSIPTSKGPLFTYKKDVNQLPALQIPPKKIHGVTELRGVGFKIVYDMGGTLDMKYSLKEAQEELKHPEAIWEDDTKYPEDLSREALGCYHRYQAVYQIDEKYSPRFWKKVYTKIAPDFWVIKLIPRKWYLGWIAKEHYLLLISGKLIELPLKEVRSLISELTYN